MTSPCARRGEAAAERGRMQLNKHSAPQGRLMCICVGLTCMCVDLIGMQGI